MTKQIIEHFTIRSVSAASAWRCGACQASASRAEALRRRDGSAWGWRTVDDPMTKQIIEHFTIRSVSDGTAWGWGPTRN